MDRYYAEKGIVLRQSIVDTLSLWNTNQNFKKIDHDFMFIQFISIAVFGADNLARSNCDEDKIAFVREIFGHRVNDMPDRYSTFDVHFNMVCQQFKEKISVEE